jgi:uncharacterized protein
VIVLADSSPLITLARAHYFELLREFFGEVIVSREVHHEVIVAGAGMPGANEMKGASWIQVQPSPPEPPPELQAACAGLGAGERSIIALASALKADLVVINEQRARLAAKRVGLKIAGSVAILERGATLNRVADLRSVYRSLLDQGIRFDRGLLDESLGRLGFPKLIR